MRRTRISTKSKQVKRRLVAIAIAFGCFVSYEATELIGDDTLVVRPKLSDIPRVPAVRSIGIRQSQPIKQTIAKPVPQTLPRTTTVASDSFRSDAGLLDAPELAARVADSDHANSVREEQGLTMLPPGMQPPPMPAATRGTGRVTVKLNVDTPSEMSIGPATQAPLENAPPALEPTVPALSLPPVALPSESHLPPLVVARESSDLSTHIADEAPSTAEPSDSGVRISIGEQGAKASLNDGAVRGPTHRTPEFIVPHRNAAAVVHSVEAVETEAVEEPLAKPSGTKSLLMDKPNHHVPTAPVVERVGSGIAENRKRGPVRATVASSRSVVEVAEASIDVVKHDPVSPAPIQVAPQAVPAQTGPGQAIDVECLGVIEVPLRGTVTRMQIDGEEICRAVAHAHSISIVGSKIGRAKVTIWTEADQMIPQVLYINVVKPWEKSLAKPTDTEQINVMIASQFPGAKIFANTDRDGMLTLKGTVTDEVSAKRIVEIVRRLYLVPVSDKIEVTRR